MDRRDGPETPSAPARDELAQVRESEARYRALAEASLEAVVIHDDGTILDVNDAFVELSGYARAEALGMSVAALVDPSSHADMVAHREQRRDDPRVYLFRRKDGAAIHVELAVRSCTYGGRPARVVVARDVTDKRRGEAAVRASEERFRLVARATNDAIWEMDLATHAVWRGETFAQLFGYRPEEVGRDEAWWWERVHPDDLERVSASLAAFRRAEGDVHADEYRFRRGDGRWAHVFDRVVLMRDAAGVPVRAIGAMMDITERKGLEQKLIVADRLSSLGTLAAGVAHEINNPLSYVIANVRLVEERLRKLASSAPDPEVLREALGGAAAALDEAREGAERVHRIVAELKTFSRAEEDDRRGPVEPVRVLDAALHLAEPELRRRARVARSVHPVPRVLASEARLGQVFLTLLAHAAESIPPGAAEGNEIRVVARTGEAGQAVIEIADSGPGMTPEAVGRIFDPFFSAHAPMERAGLGLSMCHALVTSFGGELQVESEIGRGTCFRLSLPPLPTPAAPPGPPRPAPPVEASRAAPPGPKAAPDAEAPRAPSAPPPAAGAPPRSGSTPPPQARSARVLVVDDEPMVGRMVERALGRVHRITGVTSGQQALDLLGAGERYDVILCDLVMPGMSGMDLFERVVALAPEQAQRMVFLSGGAFTRRARDFLERHPSLEKPFDLAALEAVIQARLA